MTGLDGEGGGGLRFRVWGADTTSGSCSSSIAGA